MPGSEPKWAPESGLASAVARVAAAPAAASAGTAAAAAAAAEDEMLPVRAVASAREAVAAAVAAAVWRRSALQSAPPLGLGSRATVSAAQRATAFGAEVLDVVAGK